MRRIFVIISLLTFVFCGSSFAQVEREKVDSSPFLSRFAEVYKKATNGRGVNSLRVNPTTHECVLRPTSCGANISDSTDIFTCRTDGGLYFDTWQFFANSGDRLTVVSSSSAYRVFVVLFDNRNANNPVVLASGNANGVGQSSTLTATAPGSGNYVVAIGSFDVSDTGAYTFRITCTASGPPTGSCVENSTTACMLNGRFRVTVRYRNSFDNNSANVDSLRKPVVGFSNAAFETSFFYFNDPNNIEMMVKLLDQGNTDSAGRRTIAVLFGSATPLRVEVTITDTQTGASKSYTSFFNEMRGTTDFTAFVK